MAEVSVIELIDLNDPINSSESDLKTVIMCKCAYCRKEIEQHSAMICMHAAMHRYVCDIKCMHDFYT